MNSRVSWYVFAGLALFLLGGCSVIAGDFNHWPASIIAVAGMVGAKLVNDKYKVVGWPMEFLFLSAILMIVANLTQLYFQV